MNCPECDSVLTDEEIDDRGEWSRYIYYCNDCQQSYSRLVTYKCQSSMVESDVWEHEEEVLTVGELVKMLAKQNWDASVTVIYESENKFNAPKQQKLITRISSNSTDGVEIVIKEI